VHAQRGEHNIENELRFTSHDGYVFHDSRGFESGDNEELEIVQDFVRRKSRERKLKDRLHAIWYCIPMDSDRPELNSKYFDQICPDKNVPVIAVFTKRDQFRREVRMKLEDMRGTEIDQVLLDREMEEILNRYYLANLGEAPRFVCLEKMDKPGKRCTPLLEETADALSGNVSLMLLSVQKDNLELNIKQAIKWVHSAFKNGRGSKERVLKICICAFPSIWFWRRRERSFFSSLLDDDDDEEASRKAIKKAVKEETIKKEEEEVEEFSRELLDEGEERLDKVLVEFFEEEDFFFQIQTRGE